MKNENDAPDPFDVIVVGAGIAGLALTRELYRRDIKVVALERRMDLVDSGLAINLPGNAIAALNRLGLGNDLKQVGNPITPSRVSIFRRTPALQSRRSRLLGI